MATITPAEFIAAYTANLPYTVAAVRRSFPMSLEEAQDVAQSAWARAWEKREQYAGKNHCAFLSWVMRIAMNMVLGRPRHWEFHSLDYVDPAILQRVPVSYDLDARPTVERLLTAITPNQRRALLLHYREGLTFEEMSERTSIRRETLRCQACRGLAQMRAAAAEK